MATVHAMHYPSLIVHHYTSGTGLLDIFKSDSLWATSIHCMNDSREFAHAVRMAQAALSGLAVSRPGTLYPELCAAVKAHLDSISQLALYVACFSEVDDSLSQWRSYCPRSFGYGIAFDGEKLRAIAHRQGFDFRPCVYAEDKQQATIDGWANTTLSAAFRLYRGHRSDGPHGAQLLEVLT